MSDQLTLDESKVLLSLCRTGRLYEIEDWIKAGKPLSVDARKAPLEVAIDTAFTAYLFCSCVTNRAET